MHLSQCIFSHTATGDIHLSSYMSHDTYRAHAYGVTKILSRLITLGPGWQLCVAYIPMCILPYKRHSLDLIQHQYVSRRKRDDLDPV